MTTIKTPCKPGDELYTNILIEGSYSRKRDRPFCLKVVFVGINEISGFVNVIYEKNGHMYQFNFDDFGKVVFYTKEEALGNLNNEVKR